MDTRIKQQLERAGIDVDEALGRFMGSEPLLLKFLRRFPEDENFPLLRQALEARDTVRAFEAAHTLKGVTGNLSMREFYRQLAALVEDLRREQLAAAAARMPALEMQYTQIVAVLSRLE